MTIRRRQRGFTFVEVIAATAILAICIVPATKYLADSMTLRRHLETDRTLVLLAIQTIEEQMAVINAGFTIAQESGTFASQGLPEIAYEVVRSDASAGGGIPDLLMAISVRVWSDENGNLVHESNEAMVELHTKMARSIES